MEKNMVILSKGQDRIYEENRENKTILEKIAK
jgi:hypothetical protein